MRYWLELPLVIGLFIRSASDTMAATAVGRLMQESDNWPDLDTDTIEYSGTKLQSKPLVWSADFPNSAYYFYGFLMVFWAYFGGMLVFDTISNPGLVFGALGVPPIVMKAVALGNVLVMFVYAGDYLARAVKGTIDA